MTTCLTCTNAAEPAGSISIGHNGTIQSALAKHFWFSEDECIEAVLCPPCWSKIDDFHQFYCEVERKHCHKSYHPINVLEIKQEQQFIPEYEPPTIKCEIEDAGNEDDATGGGGEESDECGLNEKEDAISAEESDPDFKEDDTGGSKDKTVRKKRKRATKAEQAKANEYIAKHLKLECSACSEKHPTFDSLQNHSMAMHEKKATIICCERKFGQKSRLFNHVRQHLEPDVSTESEKVYQCHACPEKFAQKKQMTKHQRQCHAENNLGNENDDDDENDSDFDPGEEASDEEDPSKPRQAKSLQQTMEEEEFIGRNFNLECDTCHQKFATLQELRRHSSEKHGKRAIIRCCGYQFIRKPRLIDHIKYHLNPNEFQCDICSKQFRHSVALSRHKAQKHADEESKTFRCSICPKTFSMETFLKTHEKYHQKMAEKNFHCQTCDKYFAYESSLKQHERLVHTKECPYVCHVCARGFQALSSYSSHLASHDEEAKRDRPPEERLQCNVCNIWVYKQNYRKHMLLHTEAQTCDICGKECKSIMSLRYHKTQHRRGECSCSICGKTFKKKLSLKEHMASHTGEALYTCEFCNRTFNSHANRASHRKKMHPKEWYEDKLRKNPNFAQEQLNLNLQQGNFMQI